MVFTEPDRVLATARIPDHCGNGQEVYILSKNPGELFWQVEKIYAFNQPEIGSISVNESGLGFVFVEDGRIEKTDDFGQNWSAADFEISVLINDAAWLDNDTLFAVGDDGQILIYDNGEFTAVDVGAEHDLFGVVKLDASTALAVGASGSALQIDRNGFVEAVDTGVNDDLYSIANTGDALVAVGGNGHILRSTDAGNSWDVVSWGSDADFLSVAFSGPQSGFLTGTGGSVFKTEDGGQTWGEQFVPTSEDLNSVIVLDDQAAYIAGANGTVLYTNTSGQYTNINEPVVSDHPSEINLLQNYPNPFNPSTTIQFDLPSAGDIRLEVFDLLGRRTALLYNGYKPAGNHSMVFNAGNLSSGVYIVRLQSGNHVATRSMMFLK